VVVFSADGFYGTLADTFVTVLAFLAFGKNYIGHVNLQNRRGSLNRFTNFMPARFHLTNFRAGAASTPYWYILYRIY
jgi:hypothetical protein